MQNEKTPCLCTHTVFLKSLSMNVRVKLMDMGDKRRKACGKNQWPVRVQIHLPAVAVPQADS